MYLFSDLLKVHYPHDPFQPRPIIYFLTLRKCDIFGVCCKAVPRQVMSNLVIRSAIINFPIFCSSVSILNIVFHIGELLDRWGMQHWEGCQQHNIYVKTSRRGITQMHHFCFTRGTPGIVKVRNSLSDTHRETSNYWKTTTWRPTDLPQQVVPPGLSLECQWYLFDKFCPEDCHDLVCPRPSQSLQYNIVSV